MSWMLSQVNRCKMQFLHSDAFRITLIMNWAHNYFPRKENIVSRHTKCPTTDFYIRTPRLTSTQRNHIFRLPELWNSLIVDIKTKDNITDFKNEVRCYIKLLQLTRMAIEPSNIPALTRLTQHSIPSATSKLHPAEFIIRVTLGPQLFHQLWWVLQTKKHRSLSVHVSAHLISILSFLSRFSLIFFPYYLLTSLFTPSLSIIFRNSSTNPHVVCTKIQWYEPTPSLEYIMLCKIAS